MTEPRRTVDALIVVISCHKYLATRVAALRRTWLAAPLPSGAEVILVVGRGDHGVSAPTGVVELDCPDTYEGLYLKILAVAKYVHARYDARTIVKIDDDCYVPDPSLLIDACRDVDYVGYQRVTSTPGSHAGLQIPQRFCYGGTYAMSGRLVAYLADRASSLALEPWPWEDVMTGRLVEEFVRSRSPSEKPAQTRHDPRFGVLFDKPFVFVAACVPLCVTLMHQSPRRMVWLHRLSQHARWVLVAAAAVVAVVAAGVARLRNQADRHPLDVLAPPRASE